MALEIRTPVFFGAGIATEFEELTEAEFATAAGAPYAPPEQGVFRIVAARVAQLLQDVPGNIRTSQITPATVRLPSGLTATNDAGNGRTLILRNGGTGLITVQDHLGGAVGSVVAGTEARIDHEKNDVWRLVILTSVAALDEKVKVSAADTTPGFLDAKLVQGANITLTLLNPGANEQVSIAATDTDTNTTDVIVKDEGSTIVTTDKIDFVGPGVTVTNDPAGTAKVTILNGGAIGAGGTDQFIFGDSGTVKDAFLKSGVTQHRSNDSSYLALADGEVKAVTISTERDPENNWFLQIVKNAVRGGSTITRTDISFSDSNPDTIVTVAGDFVADGAGSGFIPGQTIVVTSTSGLNNGTYTIVSVTPTTITLDAGDSLTTETAAAAGTVTITAGTTPFVSSGGDQVGTDLEKPGTTTGKVLDIIHSGLSGFTFKAGDRIQCFVKGGADASGEAKEPHVVLYIQY